jgi:hypothetical protein
VDCVSVSTRGLHGLRIHALEQRVGADLGFDGRRLELALRDRADDAVVVARGLEEHRDRPGHDDGVQDGLVAVAVHHHHVARRHRVVPHHLVGGGRAVGHEEAVVGVEDARGVALALANRPVVVQQLAQLFHRVAHVGAQHVLAVELVEHLPDRALQERHTARVARAVPRVGAVLGVVEQRLEERRLDALQVALGLADDVARHELRRVLEHVDEAVQLAQDVVGQVPAGLGLAVDVDRHVGVLAPHFADELAQAQHRRVQLGAGRELLIVDRQDERAGARLLLGELRQVAVAGDAQHLEALVLDRLGQRADAQARGVFGAIVLVDDDDGESETSWPASEKPPGTGLAADKQARSVGNKATSVLHCVDAQTGQNVANSRTKEDSYGGHATLWWLGGREASRSPWSWSPAPSTCCCWRWDFALVRSPPMRGPR